MKTIFLKDFKKLPKDVFNKSYSVNNIYYLILNLTIKIRILFP